MLDRTATLPPIRSTADGITQALGGLAGLTPVSAYERTERGSRALSTALERMRSAARTSRIAIVKDGARRLVRRGDFLDRFGLNHAAADPIADVIRLKRGEITRGLQGHWTFDFNRLVALKEAHVALRYLRRFGERV